MNSKAWDILRDDEKQALSLSINHKKSSWEAGEIMGKAHYKYLEIQQRAKRLFEIFHVHYQKYGDIIPKESMITWDFQEFILQVLKERKGYRDTIASIEKGTKLTSKNARTRREQLMDYIRAIRDSKLEADQDLYFLLLEFDRWNNFRVLPEEIQQPSAFKRRNKTRLLKHLTQLKELDVFLIDRLLNKLQAPKGYHLKVLWLPIISDTFPDGYSVIRIKATKKNCNYIAEQLKLYMFKDKDQAENYALLVEDYLSNPEKDCKKGQKFWPTFRKTIKSSANYNEINNIIPRRNKLVSAFMELDNLEIEKKLEKEAKIKHGETPVTNNIFWNI